MSSKSSKLSWGILGSGNIAKKFSDGVQNSQTGVLEAVGSRSIDKAHAFADQFDIPNRHGSYEDLLADESVQAVYISTPHPMHVEWCIKAAEAGKHILVEKPIGINHAQAMAAIEAAALNDVFLMEAFMYRCHPQTKKIIELIKSDAIGKLRQINATFSFNCGVDTTTGRLLENDLAGGGILDVGCYPISFARLMAGAAIGKDYVEPEELHAVGVLNKATGVDSYTSAVLKFPCKIIAQVSTGIQLGQVNTCTLYGTEGRIEVPDPWCPSGKGQPSTIFVHKGGEVEEIKVDAPGKLYSIEADTVVANLKNRQAKWPAMSWGDSLGNMQTLDRWRKAIGLEYNMEKPENLTAPYQGRPLKVAEDAPITKGQIKGLDKPVSCIVMGVDHQPTQSHANVSFDYFYEYGGNCFDTAFVYGGGRSEGLLGNWVKSRGLREQTVVIAKGAHTPECFPDRLDAQFRISLERLQMDYVDIYMMHRDNLEVPVGEFIDIMTEHKEAGRMKIFGVSNWTLDRIKAANEYAEKNGKQKISVVSNQFSLARMVEPPWRGCLSAKDSQFSAWLEETQTPLLPWSSQARGFFVRAAPDFKDDKELVRCWYAKDNFKRLERVKEFCEKKGCLPINVGLQFVLNQKFPTFALVGPRTLEEVRTTLPGIHLEITDEEMKWLNLED